MMTNKIYEVKPVKEVKRIPRLRNYTPLIWDNGNLTEVKQETKQEIEVKKSGRCVIL